MSLPPCDFREDTTERRVFYCRSSLVRSRGNFVSEGVCLVCEVAGAASQPLPRPADVPVPYRPRQPSPHAAMPPPDPGTWRWSYGVTVSPRAALTLERTLRSLQRAGFVAPRLFVDGGVDCPDGFAVTARREQIGAWSNWYLAAHELYQRDPHATAFAMFQDDIMLGRNLRAFLEHVPWPEAGYLNLYTASENGRGAGWFHPPLNSRGALGLVFNNATMRFPRRFPVNTSIVCCSLTTDREANRQLHRVV